jgi:NADPH2:quinone reductase
MTDVRRAPAAVPGLNEPHTMNAAIAHTDGAPFQLTRLPLPTLRPGHAVIKVEGSGVNPLDTKIRAGVAAHARTTLPAILGIDLAGVIEEVADDVDDFAVGDAVYGMTGGVGDVPGSLAEYTLVDVRLIAKRPLSWSAKQAAAVPLAAITSWEGLVDRAGVSPGDTVLIHGGAGGVGHIAIQLAISRGADVYATGSAESC